MDAAAAIFEVRAVRFEPIFFGLLAAQHHVWSTSPPESAALARKLRGCFGRAGDVADHGGTSSERERPEAEAEACLEVEFEPVVEECWEKVKQQDRPNPPEDRTGLAGFADFMLSGPVDDIAITALAHLCPILKLEVTLPAFIGIRFLHHDSHLRLLNPIPPPFLGKGASRPLSPTAQGEKQTP